MSNDSLWYDNDANVNLKMRNMSVDLLGLVKARLEYFNQQDLARQKSLLALQLIIFFQKNDVGRRADFAEQISSLWAYVDARSDKKVLQLKSYAETFA